MVQCLDSKMLGGFHSSHSTITYRDVGVEKNDREENKDIERKKKDPPTQSLKLDFLQWSNLFLHQGQMKMWILLSKRACYYSWCARSFHLHCYILFWHNGVKLKTWSWIHWQKQVYKGLNNPTDNCYQFNSGQQGLAKLRIHISKKIIESLPDAQS